MSVAKWRQELAEKEEESECARNFRRPKMEIEIERTKMTDRDLCEQTKMTANQWEL